MSPVEIRPARAADVPAIRALIRGLAELESLLDECTVTEDDLRRTLFGERPAAEVRIAAVEGQPAGYTLFFPTYSSFLGRPGIWLEDLFVLPELRRRGVGRALMADLAAEALRRGCGRLEWSVLDWNERAIAFYDALGASPVGGWTTCRLTGAALRAAAG